MSDELDSLRAHARTIIARADTQTKPCLYCRSGPHAACTKAPTCACQRCNPIPTPAEAALWAQIADEIDDHLTNDDTEGLWDE